jgi:GT2 family glycosyltransferase
VASFDIAYNSFRLLRRSARSLTPEALRAKFRAIRTHLLTVGLHHCQRHDLCAAEQEASRLISVVIPIHDAPDVTERCLQSLERNGGSAEVVLVDDGSVLASTGEIVERARQRNGWETLRHDIAVGHSRSCEHGAQFCHRPYLCLLNSDTIVTPWAWAGIVAAFDSARQIAVVGPSTSCASTIQSIARAEYCRFAWTDVQIEEFARRYTARHRSSPLVDLDYAGGFALFVRRETWERCGGFDNDLPNYGNEVELCRRLRREELRVVWTRSSYIHHLGEMSFRQHYSRNELGNQRTVGMHHVERKDREGRATPGSRK